MTSVWTWILAGIVVYTVVVLALRSRGYLPDSVSVSGPLTTVHTQRGRAFLDRLAARRRAWRAWGSVGAGVALVVMVLTGIAVVLSVVAVLSTASASGPRGIENPQNVLVIPGVNDFLPLNAAGEIVFGLLVGLVVHEGGHGLLCRVEDIGIDSMGIATLAFIPMGAFVQPDEEDQTGANRGAQVRMFAAGITNNFAVTVIALLLLVGPVLGSIAVAPGASVGNVFPSSGAEDAGIEQGDVITGVNGTPIDNGSELEETLWGVDSETVEVGLRDDENRTVERQLLFIGSVAGVADGVEGSDPLTRVETVNGTAVSTEREFARAVAERPVATIGTSRNNTTIPIGAFAARALEGDPIAEAGAPTDGTPLVVTRVGEDRVVNATALDDVLEGYEPGETAEVVAYVDGEREVFDVTFGGDDSAVLGVEVRDGYGGVLLDDFGVDPYPAEEFLSIVSGESIPDGVSAIGGVLVYVLQLLILPFNALMDPDIAYGFAGFTPDVTSFFVTEGPLSFMGGSLFLVANLLFWTGWINFNLALFNCIPAFPLDGGHILRVGTESVVSRLPVSGGRTLVTAITTGVTLLMAGALAALVFGPMFM